VSPVWYYHQVSLLYFLGVLLLIALGNLWMWRRLGSYGPSLAQPAPRVSVLVPVRDEVTNVGPCIRSLLAQDYPDYEVLALDDESHDGTGEALLSLSQEDSRLRVLQGQPLPAGWLGKNWACHQLAQVASGELLLFVDADTRHEPPALAHAVVALQAERADLASVFPRQELGSWGERLVVPMLQWSLSSFLPLGLAYRLRRPQFSASSGQFMLFRRAAYQFVGGHAAVRQSVVDDVALTRAIGASGLRWRLLDGHPYIRCRMYRNFRQVYDGLSKNLFALFDCNVPLFLFIWLWLWMVFWEPFIVFALAALGRAGPQGVIAAAGAVGMSLILWGFTYWRFGFPLHLALLYPFTVLLSVVIAIRSMVLTLLGRATWKGRRLARPPAGPLAGSQLQEDG